MRVGDVDRAEQEIVGYARKKSFSETSYAHVLQSSFVEGVSDELYL
jgi:hypothetical protein